MSSRKHCNHAAKVQERRRENVLFKEEEEKTAKFGSYGLFSSFFSLSLSFFSLSLLFPFYLSFSFFFLLFLSVYASTTLQLQTDHDCQGQIFFLFPLQLFMAKKGKNCILGNRKKRMQSSLTPCLEREAKLQNENK